MSRAWLDLDLVLRNGGKRQSASLAAGAAMCALVHRAWGNRWTK